MSPSREKWKLVQAAIGTTQDGIPGPNDERALALLRDAARTAAHLESEAPLVDDRSEKQIATLLPPLRSAARKLVQRAAEKGIQIKIISGTRTYAEQQALYDQGRSKPGNVVTNAKPGSSWHNHGAAFDIGVFRDGNYLPESPAYRTVGQLGRELGLQWGGDFASITDEPHFQMTNGKSLTEARDLHDQGKNIFS